MAGIHVQMAAGVYRDDINVGSLSPTQHPPPPILLTHTPLASVHITDYAVSGAQILQ